MVRLQGTLNNDGHTVSGYTVYIDIPWVHLRVTPTRGMVLGLYLKLTPIGSYTFDVGTLILCVIGGGVFGAWASTLIGVSTPNTQLRPFEKDIEDGKILMMIDVPVSRVQEIEDLLHKSHPEAIDRGIEPTTPVFP